MTLLFLANLMIDNPTSLYEGQVMLCPPDSMDGYQKYPDISTSFGIVALYFHGKWGGIGVSSSSKPLLEITHYRGNLICQQMGFQLMVPGDIMTKSSVLKYYSYTFNGCTEHDR